MEKGGYTVAGAAGSVAEARVVLRKKKVNLVVMDVALDGGEALALIRECRAARPRIGVVVCTLREQLEEVEEAIRAGALGCVSKRDGEEEVLVALGEAAAGEHHLSKRMQHRYFDDLEGAKEGRTRLLADLTGQQREVLHRLAEHKNMDQIAGELSITRKTVETHCRRLREKLRVPTLAGLRIEAVKWRDGPDGGSPN